MLICTPPQWLEIVHDDPLYKEEQVVLFVQWCVIVSAGTMRCLS